MIFRRLTGTVQITCGLKTDGSVWCWGWRSTEERRGLGQSGVEHGAPPTQGPVGGVADDLVVGFGGGCAILQGGTVSCWDENWKHDSAWDTTDDRSPGSMMSSRWTRWVGFLVRPNAVMARSGVGVRTRTHKVVSRMSLRPEAATDCRGSLMPHVSRWARTTRLRGTLRSSRVVLGRPEFSRLESSRIQRERGLVRCYSGHPCRVPPGGCYEFEEKSASPLDPGSEYVRCPTPAPIPGIEGATDLCCRAGCALIDGARTRLLDDGVVQDVVLERCE